MALANGFQEVKSFNLMFKKHFGQTPSSYRQHLSHGQRLEYDQFKQPLTPVQRTVVHQQLSACESCMYKLHFQEYQALKQKIAQLKILLNQ